MIGSRCRRRSGLQRDTRGLARWIREVPVHRIADCRRETVARCRNVRKGWGGEGRLGSARGKTRWHARELEVEEGQNQPGDHFRSTKRTRTLRGYVSSVDSLIVRIVHAKLTDARSSARQKNESVAAGFFLFAKGWLTFDAESVF